MEKILKIIIKRPELFNKIKIESLIKNTLKEELD